MACIQWEGSTSGDDFFSEGILIQILAWLPVISLLRFKSVCKSWRALIQSPFFIDLHIATTSKFESFILQVFEYPRFDASERDDPDDTLESDDPDDSWEGVTKWVSSVTKMIMVVSSGSGGGRGTGEFNLYDLNFSSCYKEDIRLTESIRMVGSCNGLICLHDLDLKDVFLWNPATRQCRVLPKSITLTIEEQQEEGIDSLGDDFVGFGFDVKTKDYKVVQISPVYLHDSVHVCDPRRKEWRCRVQVYSLSTDSWRLLEGINYLPIFPKQGPFFNHGIYLNGSYLFVGRIFPEFSVCAVDGSNIPICNNSLMMSFDFTKEIFTTMQFPDHDTRHQLVLSYLGDKIALFTARKSTLQSLYPDDIDDNEYYDIWVLNEHERGCNVVNKESWTKLHSFQIKFGVVPYTEPRCILNDGEFALISYKTDNIWWAKLQFFNLVTKEVESDIIIGNEVVRADVYNQSLVSIMGGNVAAAAAD